MLPQLKNSNLLTTAMVIKYKVTPYWIIGVFPEAAAKGFLF